VVRASLDAERVKAGAAGRMRVVPTLPPEGEPDYRMSLAAERTYLAYVRTALALLAAGVAVAGALPDAGHENLRRVMGIVLVLAGLLAAATARARWRTVDAAMRRGTPLPPGKTPLALSAAVVIVALLALVLVLAV
jgi:putative membrane protein